VSSSLFGGKIVYLVPNDRSTVDECIWRYTPSCPNPNFYQLLDKALGEHHASLIVGDLSEFAKPDGQAQASKIDTFIFCNMPLMAGPNWKALIPRLPGKRLILIAFEPPTIMWDMYEPKTLALFSRVLTWNDKLVDKCKFFKFCYPYLLPRMPVIPSFSEKKFLTMVARYKRSSHANELYTERRRAIRYFDKHPKFGFEFYGVAWPGQKFPTWLGEIPGGRDGKLNILKHYRFCICYENMKDVKGYITEKIFDCFAAGVIPIYWGASNIERYIPKNCYLLREDFSSMKSLVAYLQGMKEAEYNQYLANARKFLSSSAAHQFTQEKFIDILIDQIFSE
jgi:hypothetical protein